MLKLMYNGNTVTCGGGFVSFPDPAHFVTLIQNTGGTIASDKASGIPGDIVTLSNTPNAGYNFDNYSITGATLTGSQFEFGNSDVSAEGLFSRKAYTLTLQNDGHGTISATKTTGYAGDTVTLSNKYNTYYRFNNYTQTGGSLNGSTFTFGNADATAKANFKANKFTASGRWLMPYTSTAGTNSQFPITEVSLCQYKTSNTPASFLVAATATSRYTSRSTSSAWRGGACSGYKLSFAAVSHTYHYGTMSTGSCTGASYAGSTKINGVTAGGSYHWTGTVTVPAGNTTTTGLFKVTFTGNSPTNYFKDVNTGTTWTATGYAP